MKKVQLKAPIPGPGWGALTQALRVPGGNTDTGLQSTAQHQEHSGHLLLKVALANNPNFQAMAVPQGSQQTILTPTLPGETEKLASAHLKPRFLQTMCGPTFQEGSHAMCPDSTSQPHSLHPDQLPPLLSNGIARETEADGCSLVCTASMGLGARSQGAWCPHPKTHHPC